VGFLCLSSMFAPDKGAALARLDECASAQEIARLVTTGVVSAVDGAVVTPAGVLITLSLDLGCTRRKVVLGQTTRWHERGHQNSDYPHEKIFHYFLLGLHRCFFRRVVVLLLFGWSR